VAAVVRGRAMSASKFVIPSEREGPHILRMSFLRFRGFSTSSVRPLARDAGFVAPLFSYA
jgi:hypothetical protein